MSVKYAWVIWREGDLYRMRRSDGVEVTPAPVGQLGRALSCHLILNEQYEDVVQQLVASWCAEVEVTLLRGGLRQI